jgi:hypothetical protein
VDHAEPKAEIQAEQVQRVFGGSHASSGKNTNLDLDQGKSRYIKPPSLYFVYLYILIMILACALSCMSWMNVVVALRLLSNPPLWILLLEMGH